MNKVNVVIFSVGVFVCAFLCVMFLGACDNQIIPNPFKGNSSENSSSVEQNNDVVSNETHLENGYDEKEEQSSNSNSSKGQDNSIGTGASSKPGLVTSNQKTSSSKPAVTTSKKPVPSTSSNVSRPGNSSVNAAISSTNSSANTSNDGWTGDYPIPSHWYQ